MYSNEDLNFKISPSVNKLISLRENLEKIKSMYLDGKQKITIYDNIKFNKEQLIELNDIILNNIGTFNDNEYEYLINRGFGEQTILNNRLLGLSSIGDMKLLDGIDDGIVIPLFEDNKLVNCSIRTICNNQKLKYKLLLPDISIWGLEEIDDNQEIWITEGIFDMIAMKKMGKPSISSSSDNWSDVQLYKILSKNPTNIVIVSDNDPIGIKNASILKDLFEYYLVPTKVVISSVAKDAAEHYFQKSRDISDFIEVNTDQNDFFDLIYN